MTDILRALAFFRDSWHKVGVIAVLGFTSSALESAALVLLVPAALAVAGGLDAFSGAIGPFELSLSVSRLLITAIGLLVTSGFVQLFSSFVRARIVTDWESRRRQQLTASFLSASWAVQSRYRPGRLQELSRLIGTATATLGQLAELARSGTSLLILIVAALAIDPVAALAISAVAIVLFSLLRPLTRRARRYSRALRELGFTYAEELGEQSRLARDIRVFDAGTFFHSRLSSLLQRMAKLRLRATFVNNAVRPVYQYTGMLLVLLGMAWIAQSQRFSAAELSAVVLLLLRGLTYGQQTQSTQQAIAASRPNLARLEAEQELLAEQAVSTSGAELKSLEGLELDNVGFSYPDDAGDDRAALSGVSFSCSRGEIIGVVGPSGGGKSTLAQVILRLREPSTGRLLVDGADASQYSLSSWYKMVSLVPQHPLILHGTLEENIAFHRSGIGPREVERAAVAANIHQLALALSQGYQTPIGDSTRALSGGQMQRVGIARALAGAPRVLVLDEPTSALDAESERAIQETLLALRGEVLVIIIAHRLSTLEVCDRLVLLQEGRIEAVGAPAEVIAASRYLSAAVRTGALVGSSPAVAGAGGPTPLP